MMTSCRSITHLRATNGYVLPAGVNVSRSVMGGALLQEFTLPVPSLVDANRKVDGDAGIDPIVMQGRNLTIDATIVRIMKARREAIEHRVRGCVALGERGLRSFMLLGCRTWLRKPPVRYSSSAQPSATLNFE